MTDNKINTIIFFVLSILIFLGYTYFFSTPDKNQAKKPPGAEVFEQSSPVPGAEQPGESQDFQEQSDSDEMHFSPEGRLISIDTPLYHGVIDTAGGRIYTWELKKYKESTNGGGAINLFKDTPPGFSTLLKMKGYDVPELIPFEYSGRDDITVTDGTAELALSWRSPEGMAVKKIYSVDSASYVLKQRFEV
ncbi:MAG: membrane protein insertase YidC, partial [Candidatus Dadabacteria bacterium]|nr:membrane protein insertase YidC [Candidatus Dadabacteria bacterium]